MLCRNDTKAKEARDEIIKETGNENIHIVLADVSEMAQVKRVAQELQSKEDAIDAIVCNAGYLYREKRETSEGNEWTFSCHLMGGAFLLSQLLLPQLVAAKGRCIYVTSGGMYNFPLPSWDVLTSQDTEKVKYDGVNVYAYAKRGQILLAERMAVTQPDVTWVCVHPGWADTPAVTEAFGDDVKYLQPIRTPWQGAEGMAWLLGADNLENGAFYLDRKVQPKHLSGFGFREGKFTKNTPEQVDELLENLKTTAGL
jgi:dehydrogenase/reductase SDR family protein 12